MLVPIPIAIPETRPPPRIAPIIGAIRRSFDGIVIAIYIRAIAISGC